MRAAAVIAALLLWAIPAHAQRAPDMATLDRGDGINRIGLDFGSAFVDDLAGDQDAALRFELFGQFISRVGLGIYVALPLAHTITEGDDVNAVGNLDVGALYVIDRPDISFVFRGGIALPTADDDLNGLIANYFASWSRLTDLALAIPDAAYLRLAFSPLYHSNNLFFRADVGFDLAIRDDDDVPNFSPDNLFRLNVGGGIDLGTVALMAELVSLASLDDFDDGAGTEEDFVHTLAISGRFMGESLQPYVTLGVPLDQFGRDLVDFFLGAGIQLAF